MFEKCLYFNVTKFSRAITLLWDEAYRSIGLSPSHAYLLQFILKQPGETPKILAERMDLKISTVTRFIDSLSAKGLVERRKENKDKRECNVYPTKSAKKLKSNLEGITKILHKKIRKILGDVDVANAVSLLKGFNVELNNNRNK